MKVSDILAKKGSAVISISPGTAVIDVLKLMDEKNIGSVVVLDNGTYCGIVTERDYSRKVILKGKNSTDTVVADIMTTDLPAVAPTDTIDHCMTLMSNKHIRYLPVFANNALAGIISMSDVVGAKMKRQQETISHLEQYISGS
ncbi:MAG: CBS domain-containing protein [Bacteroidetes bacterium]|uniref:CBS domain-containing protein n=1 Tax=unclassified Phnomibacter TaxID=2836226 RepID=UPI002FDEF72F|nr:CBS domain-containing protein [Bacteroidota bacterium]MCC6762479.1 CBS domain-containing protein [Chitinophagaceae bacterium]